MSVPLDAFDRPYEQHTPGPPHHKIIAGQRKDVMDWTPKLSCDCLPRRHGPFSFRNSPFACHRLSTFASTFSKC